MSQQLDSTTAMHTLADLQRGESAVIASFLSKDTRFLRFREMGLLPGTQVKFVRRAPLGDPIEFNVRGCLLSIRREEAEQIEIEA